METKIINGDSLEVLKTFNDESIDCVITSPPYWQLRDYGWEGQWGLEKTYQEYLNKLIILMGELKRVLKSTGTMWINLGDTYARGMRGKDGADHTVIKESKEHHIEPLSKPDYQGLDKCQLLLPHRFAIRCIDELGLILRNDIIWAKRNGMPESVTDRFSKKHEFIFFFVKQQKYYFDLDGVRDRISDVTITRSKYAFNPSKSKEYGFNEKSQANYSKRVLAGENLGKNPGDVSDFWDIPTQSSSLEHYAAYSFDLIDKPIIAGCPEGGIVLDPFAGTGTTLLRAIDLRRKGIGIEGKKEYCEIFEKRFTERYGMFKDII